MVINFPAEGTGPLESWETILKMAAFTSQRKHSCLPQGQTKTLISAQANLSSDQKHLEKANVFAC